MLCGVEKALAWKAGSLGAILPLTLTYFVTRSLYPTLHIPHSSLKDCQNPEGIKTLWALNLSLNLYCFGQTNMTYKTLSPLDLGPVYLFSSLIGSILLEPYLPSFHS